MRRALGARVPSARRCSPALPLLDRHLEALHGPVGPELASGAYGPLGQVADRRTASRPGGPCRACAPRARASPGATARGGARAGACSRRAGARRPRSAPPPGAWSGRRRGPGRRTGSGSRRARTASPRATRGPSGSRRIGRAGHRRGRAAVRVVAAWAGRASGAAAIRAPFAGAATPARLRTGRPSAPDRPRSAPSASSMRSSWLYLATRSERDGAPVLIWPQPVATARSAIVTSSVSPERCDMTAV